jgi:hypothetical protein
MLCGGGGWLRAMGLTVAQNSSELAGFFAQRRVCLPQGLHQVATEQLDRPILRAGEHQITS